MSAHATDRPSRGLRRYSKLRGSCASARRWPCHDVAIRGRTFHMSKILICADAEEFARAGRTRPGRCRTRWGDAPPSPTVVPECRSAASQDGALFLTWNDAFALGEAPLAARRRRGLAERGRWHPMSASTMSLASPAVCRWRSGCGSSRPHRPTTNRSLRRSTNQSATKASCPSPAHAVRVTSTTNTTRVASSCIQRRPFIRSFLAAHVRGVSAAHRRIRRSVDPAPFLQPGGPCRARSIPRADAAGTRLAPVRCG